MRTFRHVQGQAVRRDVASPVRQSALNPILLIQVLKYCQFFNLASFFYISFAWHFCLFVYFFLFNDARHKSVSPAGPARAFIRLMWFYINLPRPGSLKRCIIPNICILISSVTLTRTPVNKAINQERALEQEWREGERTIGGGGLFG